MTQGLGIFRQFRYGLPLAGMGVQSPEHIILDQIANVFLSVKPKAVNQKAVPGICQNSFLKAFFIKLYELPASIAVTKKGYIPVVTQPAFARKIELEQNYPGVVKVIVIRETRVSETAK